MLLGADIPSDHIPSKACQYVLACFNDEELCNKVVSLTNGETFPQGSLLQLLSFNDWVKVLATLDKNKEAGLAALSELMAQLPNLSKNHNAKLAAFASSGAELSIFSRNFVGYFLLLLLLHLLLSFPPAGVSSIEIRLPWRRLKISK